MTPAASSPPPAPGPWAPLAQPTFRALWLAILVSNIGSWIHDVAAAWVMAESTSSPFMVAMVQSATTLPVVLLALIAGTLADIVDRRRYLILAQLWMLAAASTLALLAHLDRLGPWTLIALTFAIGVGSAMAMPAQQATTPELVPRPLLGPAVALGSLSMNIARSLGPAIGGLLVARWGVAAAFMLNALSFLGMVVVLLRWKREKPASRLPPESFGVALRAGLRYATHASVFQSVLIKAALFFLFASALTALLPIVVKQELRAGAGTFGLLLGCIGIGAIVGALLLPSIRSRWTPDVLVLVATLAYAGGMAAVALVRNLPLLYAVSLVNGFAWITVLSSLQIAAQTAVPQWVRARALSLYIVIFSGGMTVGSLAWGALAQQQSITRALLVAAVATALAAVIGLRFRLGAAAALNVMPSGHWPAPIVADDIEGERGPVLITVEYRIARENGDEFWRLMQELGRSRRRDGAVQWGIMEDTTQPGVFLEYFLVGSWLEHLRQHERVTEDDRALQEKIHRLQANNAAPQVRHFVGGQPGTLLRHPPQAHSDI